MLFVKYGNDLNSSTCIYIYAYIYIYLHIFFLRNYPLWFLFSPLVCREFSYISILSADLNENRSIDAT